MLRRTVTSDKPASEPDGAIDIHEVARLYSVSVRTAIRLADRGIIPGGFKLASCRRWSRPVILADIASKASAGNGAKT